ncbi:MAG TPA: nitrite reductase large subunit NirB [Bryobacteraceae bacterium]|jgi:nitrite reductase (NADH) large subunit|nr:nitrite reductase large subunit NirB [Bryobacteraceae bacterium]
MTENKRKLVVIGNGMAGARTVEEILARGGGSLFDITMFGDEPTGNYNRILLSNVLNGSYREDEIFLNPLEWYRQNGIRLLAGTRAAGILRRARLVYAENGTPEPYDKLIIATGSRPFLPTMEGIKMPDGKFKPGVFVFRTLEDCRGIAAYAQGKKSAAVIGGGLLGLEAARGLQNFGLEVNVVHLGGHLMPQQLDPSAGAILKTSMENLGVKVLLKKNTTAILGQDRVLGLRFSDGHTLECDMVVISAGIKANWEIAAGCGLPIERGILVDDQMRTDDRDIYAVGECAQHRGVTYGLVAPLWEQAKVLADYITERNRHAAYHGSKTATKLKVMGVEVASMGIVEPRDPEDEVVQFCEPKRGTYKKLIIREGRLVGGILLGDISKAAYLMQAFDRNTPLPEERLQLLFDIGDPPKQVTFEEMNAATQICNCNGVSKGTIVACVKNGKRSGKAVMDATRAGMGCGSCKAMVNDIVAWACGGETEEDASVHYYVPGVPLTKTELIRAIQERGLRSVSAVFDYLAGGKEDAASKPGLASLLKTLWHDEYEDELDARFINERIHANIQKDGTFSVVPQIPGGITNPAQLRRIADVAERYHVPLIKLTGGQRIDLLGLRKEDLPNVWRDLDMPSGYAYGKSYRTCKSCVGSDFCRFGLGDSISLALRIEREFQGIDSPHKMKLATAGCPRNCSEAMVKDLGAVAVEGGKWEIYIGGAAGSSVRKGDVLGTVNSENDVLLFMGRFIQYYRENAKYLERTHGFVRRLGIDKIRAVVMEDSEGIAERLDREIASSKAAYKDPWKTAWPEPGENRFSSLLPVLS